MPDARVTIEGRVGGEVRYGSSNGRDVANIRVLAGRSRKNDNGEWENLSTTAYDCAFWGEHAHLVNALAPAKGDSVEITGAITKLEFYNGQNGESLSVKVTGAGIKVFPKQQQSGGGNFGGQQSQQGGGWGNQQQAQQSPAWGSNPGGSGDDSLPPF